jgi:uncharacterized protein YbbK (DUF523 family)
MAVFQRGIKMNILVSACLLGLDCRYKGDNKYSEKVAALSENHNLIPICPEQMGGMSTPRDPVERVGGKAMDITGRDVTEQFQKGAEEAAKLARQFHCKAAVLKSKSPSCGMGLIHDGSFSGGLVRGIGFTAEKLFSEGVEIFSEENAEKVNDL